MPAPRPYISVIIPTYNDAENLPHAIESVARQAEHGDIKLKIIVVNDGSTDDTAKILANTKVKASFEVVTHDTNKGVSAARNSGLDIVEDDSFVAFHDSDDISHPQRLAQQYWDLRNSPCDQRNTLCVGYYQSLQKSGEITTPHIFIGAYDIDKNARIVNITPRVYSEDQIEKGIVTWKLWFGVGSTLFAHKSAIMQNGYFNEQIGCAEDTEYMVRHLVKGGKVHVLPKFLMTYREPDQHKKKYMAQSEVQAYMAEKYKCAIARRWGEDAAKEFIDVMWGDYKSRNHVRNSFKDVHIEIFSRIHAISPAAPCNKDFNCPLKGKSCKPKV